MLELLTAPEALAQSTLAHRFLVELASIELDFEGVPVDVKTIDVVVTNPNEAAIQLLIATTDWLKGYSLKSFWQPESDCCF